MKKIGLLMLMLCLTGLTVGCEKKTEPAAPTTPAPPAATDGGDAEKPADPA